MEHAQKGPSGEFRESAHLLQSFLTDIAQNIIQKFPNCQIAFLSSRTHAFTTTLRQNPEPYAYEGGFANKWTIETKLMGIRISALKTQTIPILVPME